MGMSAMPGTPPFVPPQQAQQPQMGFGGAIQGLSPLLLTMGQNLMQRPSQRDPQAMQRGLAMMMREAERKEQRAERDQEKAAEEQRREAYRQAVEQASASGLVPQGASPLLQALGAEAGGSTLLGRMMPEPTQFDRMTTGMSPQAIERARLVNLGLAPRAVARRPRAPTQWEQMTRGMAPEEIAEARRIALGLSPKAGSGPQPTELERILSTLPPADAERARRIAAGLDPRATADNPSARQEQLDMLIQSGVDEATARGIVAGRFKMGRDEYGRSAVQDMAQAGGLPASVPASPQQAAEGGAAPQPPGFSAADAFGASSIAGRAANVPADVFGLDLPAPQSEAAASGVRAFNEGVKRTIVDAYSGRPSNYLMQNIERLLPDPDSVSIGDQRAKDRYQALDRELAAEESMLARRLEAPLQGNSRVEADLQLQGVQNARSRLQGVIQSFEQAPAATSGSGSYPGWMVNTDPATWTDDQWEKAEEAGFLNGG